MAYPPNPQDEYLEYAQSVNNKPTQLGAAVDSLQSGLYSGAEFVAKEAGLKSAEDWARQNAADNAALAAQYQQTGPQRIEEINNVGDAFSYAGNALVNNAPQLGMQIGAGALGGLVAGPMGALAAATAISAPTHLGEAYKKQQERGIDNPDKVWGAGLANTALDIIPVGTVFQAAKVAKNLGGGTFAKAVAKGALAEGSTEAVQGGITDYAADIMPSMDDDYLLDRANDAVAGALLGGGMAGGAHAVGKAASAPQQLSGADPVQRLKDMTGYQEAAPRTAGLSADLSIEAVRHNLANGQQLYPEQEQWLADNYSDSEINQITDIGAGVEQEGIDPLSEYDSPTLNDIKRTTGESFTTKSQYKLDELAYAVASGEALTSQQEAELQQIGSVPMQRAYIEEKVAEYGKILKEDRDEATAQSIIQQEQEAEPDLGMTQDEVYDEVVNKGGVLNNKEALDRMADEMARGIPISEYPDMSDHEAAYVSRRAKLLEQNLAEGVDTLYPEQEEFLSYGQTELPQEVEDFGQTASQEAQFSSNVDEDGDTVGDEKEATLSEDTAGKSTYLRTGAIKDTGKNKGKKYDEGEYLINFDKIAGLRSTNHASDKANSLQFINDLNKSKKRQYESVPLSDAIDAEVRQKFNPLVEDPNPEQLNSKEIIQEGSKEFEKNIDDVGIPIEQRIAQRKYEVAADIMAKRTNKKSKLYQKMAELYEDGNNPDALLDLFNAVKVTPKSDSVRSGDFEFDKQDKLEIEKTPYTGKDVSLQNTEVSSGYLPLKSKKSLDVVRAVKLREKELRSRGETSNIHRNAIASTLTDYLEEMDLSNPKLKAVKGERSSLEPTINNSAKLRSIRDVVQNITDNDKFKDTTFKVNGGGPEVNIYQEIEKTKERMRNKLETVNGKPTQKSIDNFDTAVATTVAQNLFNKLDMYRILDDTKTDSDLLKGIDLDALKLDNILDMIAVSSEWKTSDSGKAYLETEKAGPALAIDPSSKARATGISEGVRLKELDTIIDSANRKKITKFKNSLNTAWKYRDWDAEVQPKSADYMGSKTRIFDDATYKAEDKLKAVQDAYLEKFPDQKDAVAKEAALRKEWETYGGPDGARTANNEKIAEAEKEAHFLEKSSRENEEIRQAEAKRLQKAEDERRRRETYFGPNDPRDEVEEVGKDEASALSSSLDAQAQDTTPGMKPGEVSNAGIFVDKETPEAEKELIKRFELAHPVETKALYVASINQNQPRIDAARAEYDAALAKFRETDTSIPKGERAEPSPPADTAVKKGQVTKLAKTAGARDVAKAPDTLFLFPENTLHRTEEHSTDRPNRNGRYKPTSGPGKIRGFDNAVGIDIKKGPSNAKTSFFSDTAEDAREVIKHLDKIEDRVNAQLEAGKNVVLPDSSVFATNALATKSPFIYNQIAEVLNSIAGDPSYMPIISDVKDPEGLYTGDIVKTEKVSETPEFDKLPKYKRGQKTMTYAGIGTTKLPGRMAPVLEQVAQKLSDAGYTLRSGGAKGADRAFEKGASKGASKDSSEIFKAEDAANDELAQTIAKEVHPNPGAITPFKANQIVNKNEALSPVLRQDAKTKGGNEFLKEEYQAELKRLYDAEQSVKRANKEADTAYERKLYGLNLLARDTYQVFGKDMDSPVDFILVYTPNGETHESQVAYMGRGNEKNTGGTGQAIRMGTRKGIPIINIANKGWERQLDKVLGTAEPSTHHKDLKIEDAGKNAFNKNVNKLYPDAKSSSDLLASGLKTGFTVPNDNPIKVGDEFTVPGDNSVYAVTEIVPVDSKINPDRWADIEGVKQSEFSLYDDSKNGEYNQVRFEKIEGLQRSDVEVPDTETTETNPALTAIEALDANTVEFDKAVNKAIEDGASLNQIYEVTDAKTPNSLTALFSDPENTHQSIKDAVYLSKQKFSKETFKQFDSIKEPFSMTTAEVDTALDSIYEVLNGLEGVEKRSAKAIKLQEKADKLIAYRPSALTTQQKADQTTDQEQSTSDTDMGFIDEDIPLNDGTNMPPVEPEAEAEVEVEVEAEGLSLDQLNAETKNILKQMKDAKGDPDRIKDLISRNKEINELKKGLRNKPKGAKAALSSTLPPTRKDWKTNVKEDLNGTLENIIDVYPDSASAHIAKRILPLMNRRIPVKFESTFEKDPDANPFNDFDGDTAGLYVPGTHEDSIVLRDEMPTNGFAVEVIMHEAVHAATYDALQSYVNGNPVSKKVESLAKEIESIQQAIKDMPDAKSHMLEYSTSDLHEFLTVALTNKDVVNTLKQIPWKRKTLYDKFTEAMRKFFGVRKSDEHIFAAVLDISTELFNEVQAQNVKESKALASSVPEVPDWMNEVDESIPLGAKFSSPQIDALNKDLEALGAEQRSLMKKDLTVPERIAAQKDINLRKREVETKLKAERNNLKAGDAETTQSAVPTTTKVPTGVKTKVGKIIEPEDATQADWDHVNSDKIPFDEEPVTIVDKDGNPIDPYAKLYGKGPNQGSGGGSSSASQGSNVLTVNTQTSQEYSLDFAAKHPDAIIVFGDNLRRQGQGPRSGQAVIRPAPNSFGIATKIAPNNNSTSFFSDKPAEIEAVTEDLAKLQAKIDSGKKIIIPAAGIGTGRAGGIKNFPKTATLIHEFFKKNVPNYNGVMEVKKSESDVAEGRVELKGRPNQPDWSLAKDQIKANQADGYIGLGSSSTGAYRDNFREQGFPVNKQIEGILDTKPTIFVSVNGGQNANKANVDRTIAMATKVLEAGGTIVMDNKANASRPYNLPGENKVQEALSQVQGVVRSEAPGAKFATFTLDPAKKAAPTAESESFDTGGSDISGQVNNPIPPVEVSTRGHSRPVRTAQMSFPYDKNARPEITVDSTFDAVVNGERTSTTRFDWWKGTAGWSKVKPGDTVRFKAEDGRTVDVIVDHVHRINDMSALTAAEVEAISKTEGWTTGYLKNSFDKANGKDQKGGYYIRYHVADTKPGPGGNRSSTQNDLGSGQVDSETSTESSSKLFDKAEGTQNIWSNGSGKFSKLSNFFHRPFTIDGKHFRSVEQAFQMKKVANSDGTDSAKSKAREKIMAPGATSAQMKSATNRSSGLTPKQTWSATSKEFMRRAVKASFEQNFKAADLLLETGNKLLTHNHSQSREPWKSEFPRILMEVRKELHDLADTKIEQRWLNAFYRHRDVMLYSVDNVSREENKAKKEQDIKYLEEQTKIIDEQLNQMEFLREEFPGIEAQVDRQHDKAPDKTASLLKNERPAETQKSAYLKNIKTMSDSDIDKDLKLKAGRLERGYAKDDLNLQTLINTEIEALTKEQIKRKKAGTSRSTTTISDRYVSGQQKVTQAQANQYLQGTGIRVNIVDGDKAKQIAKKLEIDDYEIGMAYGSLHGFAAAEPNADGSFDVYINPRLKGKLRQEILQHELGHIVMYGSDFSITSAEADGVVREFLSWLEANGKDTTPIEQLIHSKKSPEAALLYMRQFGKGMKLGDLGDKDSPMRAYMTDFDEWFADQTGIALSTNNPQDPAVKRYFNKLVKLLKKIFGTESEIEKYLRNVQNRVNPEIDLANADERAGLSKGGKRGYAKSFVGDINNNPKLTRAWDTVNQILFDKDYNLRRAAKKNNVPAFTKLADLMFSPRESQQVDNSYWHNKLLNLAKYDTRVTDIMQGTSREEQAVLMKELYNEKLPDSKASPKTVEIRNLFRDLKDYMEDAGLTVPSRKNYFPQIVNPEHMQENHDAFIEMMNRYPTHMDSIAKSWNEDTKKKFDYMGQVVQPSDLVEAKDIPQILYDNVIRGDDYGEVALDTQQTPHVRFLKHRIIDFLNETDTADWNNNYLQHSITDATATYITQSVKRVEYEKRFGKLDDIQKQQYVDRLMDKTGRTAFTKEEVAEFDQEAEWTNKLEVILDEAIEQGADAHDVQMARDTVAAEMGTHGRETAKWLNRKLGIPMPVAYSPINRKLQQAISTIMSFANAAVLGLSTITSLLDPVGIAVRSGEPTMAFRAAMNGIKEAVKGDKTELTVLAEAVGSISDVATREALEHGYNLNNMTPGIRKMNDTFFKWIGLEGWTRTTRLMAVDAAQGFLKRHDQNPNAHSSRFLKELGLEKGDIKYGPNGKVKVLTYDEYKSASEADRQSDDRLKSAISSFVDTAILRPSPSQRQVWASDPHFALLFHLKSFMYSFQKTILNPLVHEAKNGNYMPLMMVAMYLPAGIMVGELKDIVKTLGDDDDDWTPAYKENWTVFDYMNDGVQKSGLTGITQPVFDMARSEKFGDSYMGGLFGPAFDYETFTQLPVPFNYTYNNLTD